MNKPLKKILCIDDEEDILQIAQMSLETVGGYEVTAENNARDGINFALQDKPDLILIDVMMPEMDGPSALKIIKDQDEISDIPVIFMTARVQPDEVSEYLNLGACGVVAKPFDPMSLPAEIEKIWRTA